MALGNVAYILLALGFVMLLFLLFLLILLPFQLPFLWFTLKFWYSAQVFPFSLYSFSIFVVSFHPHFCSFDATCMPMMPKPLISSSDPIHASPETYLPQRNSSLDSLRAWLSSGPSHSRWCHHQSPRDTDEKLPPSPHIPCLTHVCPVASNIDWKSSRIVFWN